MERLLVTSATAVLGVMCCTQACTMIAVGKNATVDGSVIVAHTDDAGGGTSDLRLVRVPPMDHEIGSQREVYAFANGYPRVVTDSRGPLYRPTGTQSLFEPLGYIPQVSHTYGYFDQDYGLMNEMGLSIAESTCSAKTVGWPSNVEYGFNMFDISELSKVAMERCDSARCAIKTMGDLAVKYGFYSDDSGDPENPGYSDSAEVLGIADKYGEVWVFHILTGHKNASAVWAAQRVPDDQVATSANGFIIRDMDLKDTDNYMASDNVYQVAVDNGWHDPKDEFDFTSAYSYVGSVPLYPLYVGRRTWRVFDLIAPSLNLDPKLGAIPKVKTYPFSVKPDHQVRTRQIMNILRDYYEGTEFDLTEGIAAGPFGNPIRFDGPTDGVVGGWERPISIYRASFSFVLQVRMGDLPDSIRGIVWYGQDAPHGTVYVPFFGGQGSVPASYTTGKQSEYNPKSAWWAFNFVNNWSQLKFNIMRKDIVAEQERLEDRADVLTKQVDDDVAKILKNASSSDIASLVEERSNAFADRVVADWWKLAFRLVSKYSNGYVTTGETSTAMKTLGYPSWWLEATSFASWPGDTFAEPNFMQPLDARNRDPRESELTIATSDNSRRPFSVAVVVGSFFGVGVVFVVGAHFWSKRIAYQRLL